MLIDRDAAFAVPKKKTENGFAPVSVYFTKEAEISASFPVRKIQLQAVSESVCPKMRKDHLWTGAR